VKANKIANSDGENQSKIYGNAFLGQTLWDKNELFQGEKLGVKFEYLDLDEFLNESGLQESDVEFLDHLQKFENNTSNNNIAQKASNLSSNQINNNTGGISIDLLAGSPGAQSSLNNINMSNINNSNTRMQISTSPLSNASSASPSNVSSPLQSSSPMISPTLQTRVTSSSNGSIEQLNHMANGANNLTHKGSLSPADIHKQQSASYHNFHLQQGLNNSKESNLNGRSRF
jgi:hypothetical protein